MTWGPLPQIYKISKFVLGSLRLDYVLLTEGGVLDLHYEIWKSLG